jgi:DNA ligase (NAD+)
MYTPDQEKLFVERSKSILKISTSGVVPENQVEELRQLIIYHEWRYYVKNDPVISDFEYDQLYKLLEKIEQNNPALIIPDSPTQRVSTDLTEEFQTVSHLVPMLSLDNSYNAEDLGKFDEQVKKLTEETEIEYVVEPKFDGGSIAIIYENNLLTRAATRGNGFAGEEMTPNARTIKTLPLKADFLTQGFSRIELRGEAVIRKDNFAKINAKRLEEGLTLLANPRNSASGALRTKDPAETARRDIEAFIFQISYGENDSDTTALSRLGKHSNAIELLRRMGFKVPARGLKVCRNIGEAIDFCRFWEEQREDYKYEIDGMVVKVNDFKLQERCGSTSHHPRWAIAYKFKAKQATSKLLNVEYQVGKIGSVTPVAKLEPVQLAGVTVSSVSLHNEDFITGKDIRIGDVVLVERAGDVIPYIVKSMPDLRNGSEKSVDFPRQCPVCETPLVRPENEAAWRCPNYYCSAQVIQRMIFHVSKDAMDIDGFGSKYIERFHELGWLRDFSDIYALDYAQIAQLEGFGEKSADKLKASVEKSASNPIYRLLHSLSIHHLGKRASKLIAEKVGHVLELQHWTEQDFTNIPDIGPVVAQNVMEYFSKPEHIAILQRMESLGVNLNQTEDDKPLTVAEDAPLLGKTILFTGALQTMGRKEAQEKAVALGAKNISAVSGNLDILVVGEKAGSKLKKAEALGSVRILTEEEFNQLIE